MKNVCHFGESVYFCSEIRKKSNMNNWYNTYFYFYFYFSKE